MQSGPGHTPGKVVTMVILLRWAYPVGTTVKELKKSEEVHLCKEQGIVS